MRLHSIRHVAHEGLGVIEPWALRRGMTLTETRPYAGEPFPEPADLDWLVVLGGPMGACDLGVIPWLADEVELMRRCVEAGVPVLGICLGGQLLARVLGAEVRRHTHPEIGWHRVEPTAAGAGSVLQPFFEPAARVMQWHYDTFDLPEGAVRLASNEACANQAFSWGERCLGLQFHPEMTRQEVQDICRINGSWPSGRYVQETAAILEPEPFERSQATTWAFLDAYAERTLQPRR